ncbi:MAG: TonB-dependent receptor, partial [Flavisolibacter sp.]|nr:TonB-dependent receptor [Flavisolibacter sp.]
YHIERWNHLAWDAQAGIRIDHKNISTSRITGGGAVQEKNDFQYTTFASSLNIGNRIDEHWRVNGTLTLSNRAPHVNELLSNGIHHGTSTYEQGNRDLKPERSLNFSFNNTFTSESGNVILEGSFYNNNIKNFIYLQPKPDEPVLTIAGAFPKNVYEQADVRLRGFDLLASFRPFQNFEWNNKYSLLRAKNNNINDWLIRMPSDRFQSEFIYNLTDRKKIKNAYISTEAIYVWEQTRVPDESNGKQDYKLPPSGYFLWNADVSLSVLAGKFPLIFGIGLRNILNTTYRDYLNAMRYFTDEAGRNIQFRLRIPINQTF